jgi:hypothetical protein
MSNVTIVSNEEIHIILISSCVSTDYQISLLRINTVCTPHGSIILVVAATTSSKFYLSLLTKGITTLIAIRES